MKVMHLSGVVSQYPHSPERVKDLPLARRSRGVRLASASLLAGLFALVPALPTSAATTIDGPINLGTAASFSVLGASAVTNTGPSPLTGDAGVSPQTSITGFPPGIVDGTIHQTDEQAAQAQVDARTAYNVAASLTPGQTGLTDLTGLSLTPGIYSGGELTVTGELTLAGNAESVWVFQAASSLTVASGSLITLSGGATACNVFWQVGSSAAIGTGADFTGTVMADESITAATGAEIAGRLLALTGAVTLDTNTITRPDECAVGAVSTSPTITSLTPPDGVTGASYTHTVTSSGTPVATYTVSSGALPTGATLDETTGVIAGVLTTAGTYTFAVTAGNGTSPDSNVEYTVTIVALVVVDTDATAEDDTAVDDTLLIPTGSDINAAPLVAGSLFGLGLVLVLAARILTRRASV